MRYPPEHKAETRRRILDTAARLFRRHGFDGVGIETIMSEAGLTRGGFYAHFRSKAALRAAVMRGEHGLLNKLRRRDATTRTALARQGRQVLRDYLAPAHRATVVRGCTLAALSADTARGDRAAKQAYAGVVRELAAELGRGLDDAAPLDERALGALVVAVGGLLVSSAAAADADLADSVSQVASRLATRLLD